MLESFESKFLAAQSRTAGLRKQSADRSLLRAVQAERLRARREAKLATLKAQLEALEARASTTWENQRRQSVLDSLARVRGA